MDKDERAKTTNQRQLEPTNLRTYEPLVRWFPGSHTNVNLQIEHWAHAALAARIGKIAEENLDLPYSFIEDVLLGKSELDNGSVTPFEFKLN